MKRVRIKGQQRRRMNYRPRGDTGPKKRESNSVLAGGMNISSPAKRPKHDEPLAADPLVDRIFGDLALLRQIERDLWERLASHLAREGHENLGAKRR